MPEINAGKLKHAITIRKTPRTKGTGGHYVKGTPQTVATTLAAVRSVRASDQVIRDAEQYVESAEFTIRWRTGINSSMEILYGGREWAIERVDLTPFEGQFMRIWATATTGTGATP